MHVNFHFTVFTQSLISHFLSLDDYVPIQARETWGCISVWWCEGGGQRVNLYLIIWASIDKLIPSYSMAYTSSQIICLTPSAPQALPPSKEMYYRKTQYELVKCQRFYLPTDAQVNCLKNNFKIYIKTAPTCFGAVTPSSGAHYSF